MEFAGLRSVGLSGGLSRLRRALTAVQRHIAPRDPRFEQLWPFTANAPVELARRLAKGDLSPAEASRIAEFAWKGYTIFPGAIEHGLVDALVRDVRSIGDHPGCFVRTDHRNGRSQAVSGSDFDAYESVFDTYVNFESARRVCGHPTIRRFLSLLFDDDVVATQQLLFQRSNQHPIHQDTSVVCFEEPLLMVATWIALEDVVPGRGELTYFEGSHRIPHRLFRDGSKRMNPAVDDADASRRYLLEECAKLGCEKRDFIAKKGDVFVWSADLVHASNPRTRPDHESRLSVVTHYGPGRTKPFWLRFLPAHRGSFSDGGLKYQSQYYVLPGGAPTGGMQRPVNVGP